MDSTLAAAARAAFADQSSDAPEQAAQFLKLLAHKDRLKALCCLIDGERPVSEIEAEVGASQSSISQHLARMRAEGLVTARRSGRNVYYALPDDPTVQGIIGLLYARFCGGDTAP